MKNNKLVSGLFYIAALYDGVIGVAFILAGSCLFSKLGVPPPNHWGYIQFPAALLIVFAIMFTAIALDPVKNRNLILYGILLKVSYCTVISFHWITADLPTMWKPFCIADFVFLVLFIMASRSLKQAN